MTTGEPESLNKGSVLRDVVILYPSDAARDHVLQDAVRFLQNRPDSGLTRCLTRLSDDSSISIESFLVSGTLRLLPTLPGEVRQCTHVLILGHLAWLTRGG